MPEGELEVGLSTGPWQMQSWDHSYPCSCPIDRPKAEWGTHRPKCRYPDSEWTWRPMEQGAAPAHWRPKTVESDAVRRCLRWAGGLFGLGIPAMRVVDLSTGEVVWAHTGERRGLLGDPAYADPGPSLTPAWLTDRVLEDWREQVRREHEAEDREAGHPAYADDEPTVADRPQPSAPPDDQLSLF